MAQSLDSDELMIRYLLGELHWDQESEIDERAFTDTDYFVHLLDIEEQLIEDYLRGNLSTDERERFERYYSSDPQRWLKVETQRALITAKSPPAIAETRLQAFWHSLRDQKLFVQVAMASVILVGLVGIWLYIKRQSRLQPANNVVSQVDQPSPQATPSVSQPTITGNQSSLNNQRHNNQQASNQPTKRLPDVHQRVPGGNNEDISGPIQPATVATLIPGSLRGSNEPVVVEISPGANAAPVKIPLVKNSYLAYRVILKTRAGEEIWHQDGLKPHTEGKQAFLILPLPTNLLTQKYYRLHLYPDIQAETKPDIDYFLFRVFRN